MQAETTCTTEAEVVADDTERKGRKRVRRCPSCGALIVTRVCIGCRIEHSRRRQKEIESEAIRLSSGSIPSD